MNQISFFTNMHKLLAGALLCSFLASTASANILGTVLCDGKPLEGIILTSTCSKGTATTDANGNYIFDNAVSGSCTVCATGPGNCGQICLPITVTDNDENKGVDFNFTGCCSETPPCVCVNPVLLDSAAAFAVLELGSGKVTLSGPSGVAGNVAIGPNGFFEQSGSTVVTGNVLLDSGATYHPSGTATSGGVIHTSLSAQISAAIAASSGAAAQPCTQTFNTLNATRTITRTGPVNVICVQSINLGGGAILTLSGGASDIFIVNVTGNFNLGGGSQIKAAGGAQPSNILFNLLGNGPNVNVGGASKIDGSLLGVGRNMVLSAGIVNGAVISGRDINICSGEQVRCPCK